MKQILLMIPLIAAVSGCAGPQQDKVKQDTDGWVEVIDTHNARNSLDYQGTYVGTILLQDSELVNIVITLYANDFVLRLTPLEENAETMEKRGAYSWDKSGFIITLQGVKDRLNRYFVGENHLRLLDSNGRQYRGKNAENYILHKRW